MMIDLRSDTVTRPTPTMLEAMLQAPLGDDVFGEDPTVNELQSQMAEMFGHEAALFCPSGTMANQVAIRVHTRPGDEVICASVAHIYLYEGGGIARNAGASVRLLEGDRGRLTAREIEAAIHPDDAHLARTRLVALEDTVNKGGGCCYALAAIASVQEMTQRRGLALHLDGARLFNAIVAKGHDTRTYGVHFDSLSICLSKGLGCPVGSVLIGSTAFIREAHRVRKSMGGGMRQAGMLAAAGLYALDHHVERLAVDHSRAQQLAAWVAGREEVEAVMPVETNIVLFKLREPNSAADWVKRMEGLGVKAVTFGSEMVRLVTHLEIDATAMERLESLLVN